MKIIPFEELYHTQFIISEPFSKVQNWYSRGNIYSSIGRPKPSHTLLWFKSCRGKITDNKGNLLTVQQNQLTYMSKDIEYTVEFFDTAPEQTDCIVIHFQMTDLSGSDIAPTLIPELCMQNVSVATGMAIEMLAEEFKKNVVCIPDANAVIYKLLADICKSRREDTADFKYNCIKAGIDLLENDTDMSIKDIARICGVSECYFRRLFKEYSGEAPIDFRQKHRIEKAKQLLLSDMLTIGEISQELHFSDIYHFSKTFKNIVGISPSRFIENNRRS